MLIASWPGGLQISDLDRFSRIDELFKHRFARLNKLNLESLSRSRHDHVKISSERFDMADRHGRPACGKPGCKLETIEAGGQHAKEPFDINAAIERALRGKMPCPPSGYASTA